MRTLDDFRITDPALYGFLSLLFALLPWAAWMTSSWTPLLWGMYAYLGIGLFLIASYVLLWCPGVLPLARVGCAIVEASFAVLSFIVLLHVLYVLLDKVWRWMDE